MGYHRAWPDADITGVDIRPMPRYPFRHVQADAMTFDLSGYDFVHASPPCQAYTPLRALQGGKEYPDLLAATRARLEAWGGPWILENVPGAPMRSGVTLCGLLFGLRVYRHRQFEASWLLYGAAHPKHREPSATRNRRAAWDRGDFVSITGDVGTYLGREAMGIDWMNGNELCQAIPPAYTTWLAMQYGPLVAGEHRSVDSSLGADRMAPLGLRVPRGGRRHTQRE
jgi:DNA (cytosine-5)-methyltransferase 1